MINIDYVLVGVFFLNFYGNIIVNLAYLHHAALLALELKDVLNLYGIFTLDPAKRVKRAE